MKSDFRVVEFIRLYTEAHGCAPSQQDIAQGMGLTVRAVQYRIDRMVSMGFLVREYRKPRSLRVVRIGEAA